MTNPIAAANDTDRLVRWITYEFSQIPHTQLYNELFELAQITETNAEFGLQVYQMFQQTYIGTVPKVDINRVDWPTIARSWWIIAPASICPNVTQTSGMMA